MEEDYIGNPDELIPTSREEMEWKGVWEMYVKYYKADPDTDPEELIYIHKDNAARIGLI